YEHISPTYHCISDPATFSGDDGWLILAAHKTVKTVKFLPIEVRRQIRASRLLKGHSVYFVELDYMTPIWQSKKMNLEITQRFNWGRTVVLDLCLPLAFGMGFKEVYLVGCDCDYSNINQPGAKGCYSYDSTKQEGERAVEDRALWERYVFESYEV